MPRYEGALWITGQLEQRHPGSIEIGHDRVLVYIADQVVADWPRNEVQFADVGSHFEIAAEGETLGFVTPAGAAFRAATGGGLAARIVEATLSRQEPSVAQPQLVQMPTNVVAPPKKRRRWPWVVGGLILIGVIANAGDEGGSPSTTIRSTGSSNGEVAASPGNVNQGCQDYVTLIVPVLLDAAEASGDGSDAAFAAADGDITFDQAAFVFTQSADTFADSVERIEDLGTPPPGLSQAVTLLIRAFNALEAGYDLAALGAQQQDVELLTEGNQTIDDGNVLLDRAEEALGTC